MGFQRNKVATPLHPAARGRLIDDGELIRFKPRDSRTQGRPKGYQGYQAQVFSWVLDHVHAYPYKVEGHVSQVNARCLRQER
ncbi:hypothetical protein E2C01_080100 [Portunus trituberculatus]|uniref:Uncharacterized protein n=1 Tax=Portunus trituberculatus TaxID=210409 RepID=A0A5B7IL99_PORTR|nr:hypothetical protein [Portunus trituberculatus]